MAEPSDQLRVLCVLANPSDLPRFASDGIWDVVQHAGSFYADQVVCERLGKASESRLKERLSAGACDVLYFAGHAECRAGLNHTSIALESSSGEARNLSGKYFAGILGACPTLGMVVLQAADNASFCFELIAKELLQEGVRAVVMLPAITAAASGAVVARLYAALLENQPLNLLEPQLRAAHPEVQALKVLTQQAASAVVNTPSLAVPKARPATPPVIAPPAEARALSELQRKREANLFDVFLCHNSSDKPAVIPIAKRLKELGIRPWLDSWNLIPGKPWQVQLEKQIPTIRSAAVFVGGAGVGPWQEAEIEGFLDEFVQRELAVIPVLLPDVARVPALPRFLRRMVWVDFRLSDPDPFVRLVWGITGQHPAEE